MDLNLDAIDEAHRRAPAAPPGLRGRRTGSLENWKPVERRATFQVPRIPAFQVFAAGTATPADGDGGGRVSAAPHACPPEWPREAH
jgi:hypothetical protein